MSDGPQTCTKCGKIVKLTISLSVSPAPGRAAPFEKTPGVCQSCWSKAVRDIVRRSKSGRRPR